MLKEVVAPKLTFNVAAIVLCKSGYDANGVVASSFAGVYYRHAIHVDGRRLTRSTAKAYKD